MWEGEMDALEVLRRNHERIRRLLDEWRDVHEETRRRHEQLLSRLAGELELHERREEEVLYPILNLKDETRPLALEGYQENQLADWILEDLKSCEALNAGWMARFDLIGEILQMHVEEQERALSECARPLLGEEQLEEIGTRMAGIRGRAE